MRIYLSSTLNDLLPERQAVKDVLTRKCAVVESYLADERNVRDSCEADVASCAYYIGIFGLRYGSKAPGQNQSITQIEYAAAVRARIPTLLFVKDERYILAAHADAFTRENPPELIESFRALITSGAAGVSRCAVFTTPEDLKVQVLHAMDSPPKPVADKDQERLTDNQPCRIIGSPYPGLRAFRENEADRFFGRDDEVDRLLDKLLVQEQRFIALIGASGSGKSSLIYAGLIPKLANWRSVTVIPGELGDPFLSLAAALKQEFPIPGWRVPDLAHLLRSNPAHMAEVAGQAMTGAAQQARLLLFVDQIEEVLVQGDDASTRTAFFALLVAAADCPQLRVVVSMRADFYAQWPQDQACTRLLRDGHFPVAVPGLAALAEMIERPAKAAGLRFESKSLVQRILADTGTAPGALALTAFALSKLYDKLMGSVLTEAAYQEIGSVAGAIDHMAESSVSKVQATLARRNAALDDGDWSHLFAAIANLDDQSGEVRVVRRRAPATDLPGAALTLAQQLVNDRLLVASVSGEHDLPLYEVGHEAVFSHWRRFKNWFADHADQLALRRQAERAAADWLRAGRLDVMRWGWERQKQALEALRKLSNLVQPSNDSAYTDPAIAVWHALKDSLPNAPLTQFLYPEPLQLFDQLGEETTDHQRREEIGLRLNQFGDPRRGVGLDDSGLPDIEWIAVDAGEVTVEVESDAVLARQSPTPQRYSVKGFELARYPVTWCQYMAFLAAADGFTNPAWWQAMPRADRPGDVIWSFDNYPAVNVSWYDAVAFCRWLSARLCCTIRLPTECEWQWASVRATGQEYPWPGGWSPKRANSQHAGIGRTMAVGLYPLSRSPIGVQDMAGNVWEWCLNDVVSPDRLSTTQQASRVLRGGSWSGFANALRATGRSVNRADGRGSGVGFRVCRMAAIDNAVPGAPSADLSDH